MDPNELHEGQTELEQTATEAEVPATEAITEPDVIEPEATAAADDSL